MLFVNEEFEEYPPVFSEPKKVNSETEDEMARRIKCMLGEYVHEKDYQTNNFKEDISNAVESSNPLSSTFSNQKSSDQNSFDIQNTKVLKESDESSFHKITETSENIADNSNLFNNEETTEEVDKFQSSAAETSPSNSRRCSLKRQCKERISLLDYNPMFTIRTKKPKESSSNKGKSEKFDLPILNLYPEVQLIDCLSEVPNQDPPPLLNIPCSNLSPKKGDMTISPKNKCKVNPINKDTCKNVTEESSSFQYGKNEKKQLKKRKKKKIRYESLPIAEDSNIARNAQEQSDHLGDSNVGSCQIKNGVIKIRLSKLHDKKNDVSQSNYEVSFCEKDALSNCKKLSVPLSPLAPAVYDVYCASYKRKKHSKQSLKKKHSRVMQEVDNNLSSTLSTTCATSKYVDSLTTKSSNQNVNDVVSMVETCVNKSISTIQEKVAAICMDESKELEKPQISENISDVMFKPDDIESTQQTNVTLKEVLPSSNSEVELKDSKIMCSIDLSLIDRIPIKITTSNVSMHPNKIAEKEKSSKIFQHSTLNHMQTFVNLEENSNIKVESFTPAYNDNPLFDCDLKDKVVHSTHHQTQEIYTDDACPNLTPVYPFEAPIAEGDSCISSYCDKSVAQDTSHPTNQGLISDHLVDKSSRINSLFSQHSHLNKIKIEVPDAILSNHERWNEYKEYKWCRDFTDVIYRNGGTLFKEQFAYNGLWQDPELKKPYSSEYYLNEAKKLKHQADKEIDRMVQAMKYLEAVLYFILTGNAMEHSYIDTDRVHTMYKETLALIRFISSKFQKLHNASCRNIDNKLTVLSLRCQSLLYLKMYQLRRDEIRSLHRTLTTFQKSENILLPDQISPPHVQVAARQNMIHPQMSPCHQASPCSFTPSPAGSVASMSSQSSGYNSSEIGWSSTAVPSNSKVPLHSDVYSDPITVSHNKYKMLQQQVVYLANLHLCHDLWEHADYLSSKEHSREFFLELDEECGCLSLHSPFSALVHYVRKGLYKLKDGT